MKKQILSGLLTLAAASMSFAAPVVVGDVKFKDELVVLKQNIVCNAYSAPADDIRPETIINGEYTSAMVVGDDLSVQGLLDGDLFTIHGTRGELMTVSLQEYSGTKASSYSFSSSGLFSNMTVHNQKVQNVSLTIKLNGRYKSIGCSVQ